MNRRKLLLIVIVVVVAVLGVQFVAAQGANMPQAVVSVERTVLRDAPSHAGAFVAALSESTQVTLLEIDSSGMWFEIETAEGVQGWGRALHYTPLSRARVTRTLVVFEAPNDQLNYVTGVDAGSEVLILQTDETGEWSRVLAPDGQTGWTETALLRFDYGVATADNIVLYNWPDATFGQEAGRLSAMTPVFIKDILADGRWIRVTAGTGETGWADISQFLRTETAARGVVELTDSEMANLRTLPAIDAISAGTVPNAAEVWVAGRDSEGRWYLISTSTGQLAWISSGLIDFLPGEDGGSLAVLVP